MVGATPGGPSRSKSKVQMSSASSLVSMNGSKRANLPSESKLIKQITQ